MKPLRPLLLVTALTSPAWLGGCSTEAEPKAATARSVNVEVSAVRRGEMARSWSAVGSLLANESVVVRPEITGRIARIGFAEGQRVREGSMLVELDDSVFVAQTAQAQANVVLSTRNATRAEELFARGLISPADRDTAAATLGVDTANLRLARAQAAKARLSAPFSGQAGLRSIAVGDYVNPGQDLVVLEDLDRIKLEFRLPELALRDVREGQSVQVELDAYPGETFAAELYAVDSRIAADTRSFGLRAVLDNADGRMRPGLFARVQIVVELKPDALIVPEQAVLLRGAQAYVFEVAEGRAVEREVKLGQRRPGEIEVLSGLKGSEQVVIRGLQNLANGTAVTLPQTAPPA